DEGVEGNRGIDPERVRGVVVEAQRRVDEDRYELRETDVREDAIRRSPAGWWFLGILAAADRREGQENRQHEHRCEASLSHRSSRPLDRLTSAAADRAPSAGPRP